MDLQAMEKEILAHSGAREWEKAYALLDPLFQTQHRGWAKYWMSYLLSVQPGPYVLDAMHCVREALSCTLDPRTSVMALIRAIHLCLLQDEMDEAVEYVEKLEAAIKSHPQLTEWGGRKWYVKSLVYQRVAEIAHYSGNHAAGRDSHVRAIRYAERAAEFYVAAEGPWTDKARFCHQVNAKFLLADTLLANNQAQAALEVARPVLAEIEQKGEVDTFPLAEYWAGIIAADSGQWKAAYTALCNALRLLQADGMPSPYYISRTVRALGDACANLGMCEEFERIARPMILDAAMMSNVWLVDSLQRALVACRKVGIGVEMASGSCPGRGIACSE